MKNTCVPDDHFAQISYFLELLCQRVKPRGVIHVGAHRGEEVDSYLRCGFENVVLIEANPQWFEYLKATFAGRPNIKVFGCAVADMDGTIDLQIHTSRSGSTEPASILPMKRFKEIVKTLHTPRVVTVPAMRLDTLFERHGLDVADFNFMNIDVQGAEHLVFQGAGRVLQHLDAVLTEINVIEMYDGCAREQDIERILAGQQFARLDSVYHELYDEKSRFPAWGESLFVKQNLLTPAA